MKKQGFFMGSLILLATVAITKVLGLMFKIPLANILGGVGMGYFSCAYAVFMPVYAISVTGLPAAVSRMVAENMAFERYANVKKIRRVGIICFSAIGIGASVALALLAKPLTSGIVQNADAFPAVLAIAPCIYFGAVTSVYRGYYEGMRNMIPTAISEIIEAIGKVTLGIGFTLASSRYFSSTYEQTGFVLDKWCATSDEALLCSLPYVATSAIFGVTLSNGLGALYLAILYKIRGDGITTEMRLRDKSTDRMRVILKKLVMLVVPIAMGALITNLTSLIDLASIIRSIKSAITNNADYMMLKYADIIDSGVRLEELPNFIYGSYTGLAITIFNLIPALTAMFGKSVLPNVAEGWAIRDKARVGKSINAVLFATSLIAVPAGLGISVMSEEILKFLYKSRVNEVAVSTQPLAILGIGIIFLSYSIPVFAMLQGIGRADLPLKIMLVGVIIKLLGNILLVSLPQINILGAGISTLACYAFISVASISALVKETDVKLDCKKLFVKPSIAGINCAMVAFIVSRFFRELPFSRINVLISIVLGGIFYIFSLCLLGVTPKNEVKSGFFK